MKTISKIIGLLLIIGFSFLLGWQFSVEYTDQNMDKPELKLDPSEASKSLALFQSLIEKDIDIFLLEEILEEIEKNYVDDEKLFQKKLHTV